MSEVVTDPRSLTPVQNIAGLYLKRDDLFAPYGIGDVNGGKLRQCKLLVEKALSQDDYRGCVTYCSIHSPQAPITSAVCQELGIGCKIIYGGTKESSLNNLPMARLVKAHHGEIDTSCKTGRHNVLHKYAKEIAEENNYFLVQYGFNLESYSDVLLEAVTQQVQNIPDKIENLVITCGSGITTSGVLLGLQRYKKEVENIHLVCTAPNRDALIKRMAGDWNYVRHDLYHQKGFVYENGLEERYHGIRFHPNYEAKTFNWLKKSELNIHNNSTLMWIVGAEPVGW